MKNESGALRVQGDSEKMKSEVWAGMFETGALRLHGAKANSSMPILIVGLCASRAITKSSSDVDRC